ncbi:MAG: SNF2-related protein [Ferruginibacter sp.]|nr:SNF2-related protein [Ferruginibacter sp.]
MHAMEWQTILRRQIAEDENFIIKKMSDGLVFGDYKVESPKTSNIYKVALRSADNSLNFCSCPDFKTNQLGTCKHIEAVLLKIKSKPGSRKQLTIPYIPPYTSVYLDYRGEREVRLRIGTENTAEFKKLAEAFFDSSLILHESSFLKFEVFLKKAHALHPEFRCYTDALEYIVQERNSQHRQQLVAEKRNVLFKGISNTKLFRYQQKGVLFAVKAGRCILADDMGLGKTLQAIVSTEALRREFNISTALIICPTSLKYQWKTEIEKFTGNKNVCVVEGNILARKKLYASNTADYIIVSYQMASNDFIYLDNMQADVLILDEAQRIKNWKTKTSAAIKRIKTTYAFVLTGTPVENKIEDLYSLMQIVNPFKLGSLHNFLSRHQVTDDVTGKVIGYKDLNDVGVLLKDSMLRRTKQEVLKDLPLRMDKILFVPLTPQQAELHKEYADRVARLVKKWKHMHFLSEEDRQNLLKFLNMMRMASDSTFIIDQETNYQTKLDELQNILDEILAMPGEKVVIFSQWERMTRLVATILKERNIGFEYLHGGIPGKDRGKLYANFTNDENCKVFLSTDAGGVGLNLQSAAYMINLDIPWNPAVLEQRIGRIYRLGQKKNVSIINLVSQDSIEHRMLDVLKFKTGVAAGILDGGDNDIFMSDDKFNQFMKSVESVTSGLTEIATSLDTKEERDIEKQMAVTPDRTLVDIETTEEEIFSTVDNTIVTESKVDVHDEKEIVDKGLGFFEGLLNILSNRESTQRLVNNITETDQETGQTYLKLPISNTGVVENALKILGGLFGGMNKK